MMGKSSDQYSDARDILTSFISSASKEKLNKLFPGASGAPGDALFPVCLEVPQDCTKFRILAGDGTRPVSLCFSKLLFAGWSTESDEISDVSAFANCTQSSIYVEGANPKAGATGGVHHNNVHTLKELEPWWQAEFPAGVRIRYLYFYRRADKYIVTDESIRVTALSPDGAETELYHSEGHGEHRDRLADIIEKSLVAISGLRDELPDSAQPIFDHTVTYALSELTSFAAAAAETKTKMCPNLDAFIGEASTRITDMLLKAAYLALGETKDFGLNEADALEVSLPRRSARYIRLRAYGELPAGFQCAEFGLKGAAEPVKRADRKALKFTYSRPPIAFPESYNIGLTTRPQSRQVDFGSVQEFDYFRLWNIDQANAANTFFIEISCRANAEDPWEVIYDHGAAYRHAVQLIRLINLIVKDRWTPSYGALIGKLFTQYRRRALMMAVAKFTREDKSVQDAVFHGSNQMAKTTRFASPLRLGKHGLGVPIAYRETKVVMGHMAEMRDKIRALGHKPLLMYGTLLGAIREKDFIPHDDDVDFAVILEGVGPDELNAACDKFVETLNDAGVKAKRGHAACPLIHCHRNPITYDIFILGRVGDTVFWPHAKLAVVPERADIFLPTKVIEFKGEAFDGPFDPKAVCEARYGKDWHIPNPAFEW